VSDKVILRKRSIIETINEELKNMAQVEHSRHRSFHNFVNNLISGLSAYCFFPKKPMLRLEREIDNQLTIF
ncbi:MAG: transposase, partial [bacterium]|nr:transposase [bacterium]